MDRKRQGQAPFGFRWQGGCLHQQPEEVKIRRLAFSFFLDHRSMTAVARALNQAKLPTRRGGLWSDVQVARLLSCSSAIGRYEADSITTAWIECEPLVSREVWERTQQLLTARRKKTPAVKSPGAGLVWCQCGQRMLSQQGGEHFTCAKCRISISGADLEAVFSADFSALVATHPTLQAALTSPAGQSSAIKEIAHLEGEMARLRREREAAERMFGERAIDKKRFIELHEPLEVSLKKLARRLASLLAEQQPTQAAGESKTEWRLQWAEWPATRREALMAALVSGFVVAADEVEISYLLPEPSVHQDAPSIRLPKAGELCPITGLSRAKMNELILPTKRNNFRPPVASKSLKQPGQVRGVRLVVLESLLDFLQRAGH
jgi:hypothetical protein